MLLVYQTEPIGKGLVGGQDWLSARSSVPVLFLNERLESALVRRFALKRRERGLGRRKVEERHGCPESLRELRRYRVVGKDEAVARAVYVEEVQDYEAVARSSAKDEFFGLRPEKRR